MKDNSLNLFFGQAPNEQFLGDLGNLKKLEEKDATKLIDHVIDWYPKENIDNEWKEWFENFTKEEKEEKKSIIRIILFIFKEFAGYSGHVVPEETGVISRPILPFGE